MPLFVVLAEGAELDEDLVARDRARACARTARRATSRARCFAVAEVPRTLSGKVLEVPVKRILMGEGPSTRGEPRLAGQPGRARLVRGARGARGLRERRGSRWRTTPRNLGRLVAGLWLFGTGEGLLVASELGNTPWTVLSEGVSIHTPLSIGVATIAISGAVLLAWMPLRQRPGLGTLLNAMLIGIAIDVTLAIVQRRPAAPRPLAGDARAGSRSSRSAAASTSERSRARGRATA